MSHPRTDAMIERMAKELKEAGVGDYVIALADPDDEEDIVRFGGSVWWRIGLGRVLQLQAEERQDEDGRRVTEDEPAP